MSDALLEETLRTLEERELALARRVADATLEMRVLHDKLQIARRNVGAARHALNELRREIAATRELKR